MNLKWNTCVNLIGEECEDFLSNYLDKNNKTLLVIGGAGFDPRTTVVASRLNKFSKANIRGIFFREERIMDQPKLRKLADLHQSKINSLLESKFVTINIFAEGITPVGGRQAVAALSTEPLTDITDIILDGSALSTGVIFPITRLLLDKCNVISESGKQINLHLFTIESPTVDHKIRGVPSESVTSIHGFRGDGSLESIPTKPILWLPTLAPGAQPALRKIYNYLSTIPSIPIDVCPIIPFPGHDPRLPDKLILEFNDEIMRWRTDYRNLLYAAESDPVDAYRTICAIHAARNRIFNPLGGSIVVLSPVGNKLLSFGAMLAAIENNLPVYMVESVGYDEDAASLNFSDPDQSRINAIWLSGEAYTGCKTFAT